MLLCWIGTLNSYDYEKDEKTCNCINPFANTADRNLRNPDILCNLRPSQRRWYIEAYKNCTDTQKASGIRRWTSRIACVLRQPKLCRYVPEKSSIQTRLRGSLWFWKECWCLLLFKWCHGDPSILIKN